jgi:hypothetical protein
MKIRHGFVSNSSSSSFCIIGTEIGPGSRLTEALGLDLVDGYQGHGTFASPDPELVIYGDGDGYAYIGFDAEKVLQTNTIPEAIQKLVVYVAEKYGIALRRISFHTGEAGN